MAWSSRIRSILALVLPVLGTASCGGGAGPSVGLAEIQRRFVNVICKFEVACGDMPDLATCLASQQMEPGYLHTIEGDIASGKVHYDGAKAGACIQLFERLYGSTCSRSALASAADDISGSTACAEVIAGTVLAGGACFFPDQCESGLCQLADSTCSRARQCCAGTCVAKPAPIPVGGNCSAPMPNQSCDTGAICISSICTVPSRVEGAACTSSFLCASPLYCDLDSATSMGTCRRAAPSGAACSGVFSSCDDLREYCDPTSGTCKTRVAVGGTCDVSNPYNCVGYAQCEGTTCVARLKAGETCSSSTGPDCLGSLECDAQTNTCALAPVIGVCS
jgi:hypothetical protein